MPQGGVDKNEDFFQAAKRELEEETSVKTVEVIKELNEWLTYDLPKNLLGKLWKGKYRGQKQKWFVMKFLGKNDEINIRTKKPEFLDWKWIHPSDLPGVAVGFKVNIYKKMAKELASTKLN
jgi:putative (di)nucleoside polyphosphate hydrolase